MLTPAMLRTIGVVALATVVVVLALQMLLPTRRHDYKATEVLGLLAREIRMGGRGIALADIARFGWDEACAVRAGIGGEEFSERTGIHFPDTMGAFQDEGAWHLVFAEHKQAAALVPVARQSVGDIDTPEPVACSGDREAWLVVLDSAGPGGPPRKFQLKTP